MPSLLLIMGSLLLCSSLTARPLPFNRISTEVGAVFGYERTRKTTPNTRLTDRMTYGVRLVWGVKILAAEVEYLRARDAETIDSVAYVFGVDRIKAGIRSRLPISSTVRFVLRVGYQLTRSVIDAGGTFSEDLMYKPYLGAGIRVRLSRYFSTAVEAVGVFNDFPGNYVNNDYQLLSSITLRFP